ncbi:MAG: Ig-like domain-containing protein [Planctomycetes bacterium]|nr:Ig-like domain-containing protein [Planctomycetota bacterium]
MIPFLRSFVRVVRFAALGVAAAWLPGCDNPACVFGPNGCQSGGGTGAIGSEPAAVPGNHTWLRTGAPTITAKFPAGSAVHPDSPLVLVFSESMSSSKIQSAFRLEVSDSVGQLVPLASAALVGDGRMLVLFPAVSLQTGTSYTLAYADGAVVTDLQGTPIDQPLDKLIQTFKIADTAPTTPKVVATWPVDGASDQSPFGEFVAVFDRRVNPGTVDTDSFDIQVDGAAPAFDPLPQALLTVTNGLPVTDTRVFRWRSVDSEQQAVDLGQDATVEITLSPSGHKIRMADNSLLAETAFDYETASFAPPLAAEMVSLPFDGIGIAHLTGGNAKVGELEMALTIEDGQATDLIGVFVFGTAKNSSPPELAALYREFELGDVPYDSNTDVATIREPELDLVSGTSPLTTRFADGPLYFAFRVQRGSVASSVRLLDADVDRQGTQVPTQDTKAPTLTGFGLSGSDKSKFRSDLRNFALVGRASEPIESVEITTALGDNGSLPSVVASNSSGLFVAQPFTQPAFQVALDPLAGNNPLDFQVVLYDRALNESATTDASFTQLGAIGTGTPLGATVTIEVFDASTLAAIADANVFTHEDFLLTVTPVDFDATDSNGLAVLDAATLGDTLVTVDAPGYDLVTLFGVTTDRVSIGLTKTGLSSGTVDGLFSSGDGNVADFERVFADTRQATDAEPLSDVQVCSIDPTSASYECPFGPYDVLPNRIGAVSIGVLDTPAAEFNYTAAGFLKGFAIEVPVKQASAGGSQDVAVDLDTLLDDPSTTLEDVPIDGPAALFDASAVTGVDLGNLDGAPRVLVASPIPALVRAATVGFGVAFDQTGGVWKLRSAYPGVADPTDNKYPGDEKGELVLDGTIEADLMLHCEARDVFGARSGRRPRVSDLTGTLLAPNAPQLLVPTPGSGATGGEGFDVEFENSLPDAEGVPGLYCVTLTDDGDRAWRLWVPDPSDASPTVRVHAPDLLASGGVGLEDGTVRATIELFAWPSFAWDGFFWTDIGREHDHFAKSAPFTFQKP